MPAVQRGGAAGMEPSDHYTDSSPPRVAIAKYAQWGRKGKEDTNEIVTIKMHTRPAQLWQECDGAQPPWGGQVAMLCILSLFLSGRAVIELLFLIMLHQAYIRFRIL